MKNSQLITFTITFLLGFSIMGHAQPIFEVGKSSDNCGCGLLLYMGLVKESGSNNELKNSYYTLIQSMDYEYYKELRSKNRQINGEAKNWFTPFNETSANASDDVKEEKYKEVKKERLKIISGSTQTSEKFNEIIKTSNNSKEFVECINICKNDVFEYKVLGMNERSSTIEFRKNSQGDCKISGITISPKSAVANMKEIKKQFKSYKRSGFNGNGTLSFIIERKNQEFVTFIVNSPNCQSMVGYLPAKFDPPPPPPAKESKINISLVGASQLSTVDPDDPNSIRPSPVIQSHGSMGGFTIEERTLNQKVNGQVYFTTKITIPNNSSTVNFNVGEGKIVTVALDQNRNVLTKRHNDKRRYVKVKDNVSAVSFGCKYYFGKMTGTEESYWQTKSPIAEYGTNKNEESQNPRRIHGVEKTISVPNNTNEITCICRYTDTRKDDEHTIIIPYSELIIK